MNNKNIAIDYNNNSSDITKDQLDSETFRAIKFSSKENKLKLFKTKPIFLTQLTQLDFHESKMIDKDMMNEVIYNPLDFTKLDLHLEPLAIRRLKYRFSYQGITKEDADCRNFKIRHICINTILLFSLVRLFNYKNFYLYYGNVLLLLSAIYWNKKNINSNNSSFNNKFNGYKIKEISQYMKIIKKKNNFFKRIFCIPN